MVLDQLHIHVQNEEGKEAEEEEKRKRNQNTTGFQTHHEFSSEIYNNCVSCRQHGRISEIKAGDSLKHYIKKL